MIVRQLLLSLAWESGVCIPSLVFLEHSTAFCTSMLSGVSRAEAPAKSSAKAAVIDEKRMMVVVLGRPVGCWIQCIHQCLPKSKVALEGRSWADPGSTAVAAARKLSQAKLRHVEVPEHHFFHMQQVLMYAMF